MTIEGAAPSFRGTRLRSPPDYSVLCTTPLQHMNSYGPGVICVHPSVYLASGGQPAVWVRRPGDIHIRHLQLVGYGSYHISIATVTVEREMYANSCRTLFASTFLLANSGGRKTENDGVLTCGTLSATFLLGTPA